MGVVVEVNWDVDYFWFYFFCYDFVSDVEVGFYYVLEENWCICYEVELFYRV